MRRYVVLTMPTDDAAEDVVRLDVHAVTDAGRSGRDVFVQASSPRVCAGESFWYFVPAGTVHTVGADA